MAYLQLTDYTLRISVVHLNEILTEGTENSGLTQENMRQNAEAWAIAMMKSYLKTKYDIDGEFAKTGDTPTARNRQIMQVLIDLVLCTIHKTINPRDIPDHIQNGCDNAMAWLKEARDGLIVVDLPNAQLPTGAQEFDTTFMESQPKFVSKPYTDLKLFDNEQ